MSEPGPETPVNLNPAADEFVPSPSEAAPTQPSEEEVLNRLEQITDHFHEEMFKPFNGNYRNLTLFFPEGLATFDYQERWFIHPWFWSDFVQNDRWYSTVNWRQYQQFKPLKYSCAVLAPDSHLFMTGGLGEKLAPSDRCIRARVKLEWGGNRSENITPIANLLEPRYLHSMVLVAGKIFVLGGQRKDEGRHVFLNSCECLLDDTWRPAPPMTVPRSTFSASVQNNTIYAFGGFSACGVLAGGIEKLQFGASEWTPIPVSLDVLAGVGTVYSNNLIWIIGGSDGDRPSDRILAFDPRTELTTELMSDGQAVKLTKPRAKAIAFAAEGNKVFVFGGGVYEGEKFRNLKGETLEFGSPSRIQEEWLLACPYAIKSG